MALTWKVRTVKDTEMEKLLNELEMDQYEIHSVHNVSSGYDAKFVVMARKQLVAPITVLPVEPAQTRVRAGSNFNLTFRWRGGPAYMRYWVFVHVVDKADKIVIGGDHPPPKPTDFWTGEISYQQMISTSAEVKPGTYPIVVGMYDRDGDEPWATLQPGENVIDLGGRRYQVGTVVVE